MKQIIFLFGFLLFLAGCENKPKPTATRNIQPHGDTFAFSKDSTGLDAGAENLGTTCTEYPYFDGVHRLSVQVDPKIKPEDNLITWFIWGHNPNTTVTFLLTAYEVDYTQIQSYQIPTCPDPSGWILTFRTTYPRFTGNVFTCQYGYNQHSQTYFENEQSKDLALHWFAPYQNGKNSCTEPLGYITQPWCTGETVISGTVHDRPSRFFYYDNSVAFCGSQQNLQGIGRWEMNPTLAPLGPFQAAVLSYPIPKKGIPGLTSVKLTQTSFRAYPGNVSASVQYSVNGTLVYTDSFPTNAVTLATTCTSTATPCVFQK